ncbi:MAG TPA: septal ring lytic transglycosylase RlpA family protein [Hyphomicrobium sp.]|nr:septal ring lytic transglycosylase RlpA family protein [Hyphomicrobium sp.]
MAWSTSTWAKRVRLVCIAPIALTIAAVAIPAAVSSPVEAKTPGKTYCFVKKCHRVKTIAETEALVGVEQAVVASHYDDCKKDRFNPCGLTSSGERFHPDRPDNTASPVYPDGTTLLVWNPDNKRALVVRVNNAGPYWGNRTLDLSRAAAEKLGFAGRGVAKLKMRVVKAPEPEEARYKKNREYDPVPGDIGQYASLDEAQRGMAVVLAFKATTGSPFAPVTTANAFSGQSIGSGSILVAEAPQAMGRVTTIAYSPPTTPLAFGGFRTQSRAAVAASRSLGAQHAANQSEWDEDRVVDGPVMLSAVTETSSITAAAEKPSVAKKDDAKAKLAAAVYDDAGKDDSGKADAKKKKSSENRASGKAEKPSKSAKSGKSSRRSRRQTAEYEERGSRGYREHRPRYAYSVERDYAPSRSAGQLMSDNLRPL